ncbi:MAG: hypothetical protein E7576_14985 [Ruminococcaceae bacterium]|jgi:hypothetical protein|nr:hypothetical protein [Oscillospiraceae bacterium]
MKKAIALLLAVMMSAAVSCSETTTEPETLHDSTPANAEAVQAEPEAIEDETEITRENTPDSLPADLDFGGMTLTIYYSNGFDWTEFIEGGEELTGEVVSDTAFENNQSVAERLNMDLAYYAEDSGDYSTINSLVSNLIMANDSTYDVYLGEQYGLVQTAVKGYYRNAFELPYLDFEKPWWNVTFMENLQLTDDYRMFMTGDFSLTTMNQLFVQYFNKRIYTDLYGDPDELYGTVLEGAWTVDKMSELISSTYADLNGNGKVDPSDRLGYVAYMTYSTVDPFMYCGDVPYTSRDEAGHIVIDMNQERAVTLTEKVVNLFNQTGSYTVDTAPFTTGGSLFCAGLLRSASGFRDMEDDFGFLPSPKLDEEQEYYRNLVGDCNLFTVIPVTCVNAEMAAAVLEALNAQTYRTLVPAWYEVSLKLKYSRDLISSDIIDLIHDSIYTDFLFAYSPMLSQMGQVMRDLVTNNSTNYMSNVASRNKVTLKLLDKMYKDLEKNQNP